MQIQRMLRDITLDIQVPGTVTNPDRKIRMIILSRKYTDCNKGYHSWHTWHCHIPKSKNKNDSNIIHRELK